MATIHPSNENAIGAIAAIHPKDCIFVTSDTTTVETSPNISPVAAININGIIFITVEAF